jgi:RNA polymerase primary sigma factor
MENVFQDKALQKYLKEISKIKPLSAEEEKRLAYLAKKGDKEALNKLLLANLKFVVKIAAKYQNRGLTLAELISEGNDGLIKAIEKFDPDKDIKLISYAVWWIRQRILQALAEKTTVVKLPISKVNVSNKIKQAKERYYSRTGKEANSHSISEITDIDEKAINKLKYQEVKTISLDSSVISDKHDTVDMKDFLQSTNEEDPKTLYYRERLENKIESAIKKLPSRDAFIIKEYFGLDGKKAKNFAQIAQELGLSRERVRQIQKKALKKILKDTYEELESDIDYLIQDNL